MRSATHAQRAVLAALLTSVLAVACASHTDGPSADGESAITTCADDVSAFPTEEESATFGYASGTTPLPAASPPDASPLVLAMPAVVAPSPPSIGLDGGIPSAMLMPLADPSACRKTTRDAALDCVWAALGLKYTPGSKAGQAAYTALSCLNTDSSTDKALCLNKLAELIGAKSFPAWRIYIATVSCGIILPAHAAANTLEYYTTNPCEEKAPTNGADAAFTCMTVADSKETLCGDIKDKRKELAAADLAGKTDFCQNECASIYNGCFNPITDPSNQRGRKFECWGSCVAYCKATLLQLKPNGDREPGAKDLCGGWSYKW